MKAVHGALLAVLLLGTTILPAFAQEETGDFVPVTDEMLANPADGDWLMWRRTLNAWGYSPLDQIDRENVSDLSLSWSRGLDPGFMEATPLVYDGVMYIPHGLGVVMALDATNGDLIWEYRRQLPSDLSEFISSTDIVRNLGIYEDKIIYTTPDAFIIAINAQTGAVEWETQVNDYRDGGRQSSGPIVANGIAYSGRACSALGGPETCFLAAHDLETGEELWRTYTMPRPGEPGDETWGNIPYESRWHVGSWIAPSYDPELNMVYFGTSVTWPYSKFALGSDDPDAEHLYQTSTLALDGDTGEIVWYQQHIRDQWDLDHPFERILVDTEIAPNPDEVRWINPNVTPGEERRVLTGIPGKTGIFYSIDRETGEFLWARETTLQTVVLDIDPTNGRATMNSDLFFTENGQTHYVCPGPAGGKDWPAGAYSPLTNAIYYPLVNLCMNATVLGDEPSMDGQGLDLVNAPHPDTDQIGSVRGINVETGEQLWLREQRAAIMSLVTTGGGLIFGGDVNRRFMAMDQESGEVLWETVLGGPVGGFPISYEVDGRQYVAVATGGFLNIGRYLGLAPELRPGGASNHLFVFALPED